MKHLKKLLLIVFCCTMAAAVSGTMAQAKSKNKGSISKTVKWSYNKKSKTLTISGKGTASAKKFDKGNKITWPTATKSSLPKFKKIVFKKGITKVDRKFFDIEGVTSISLPSTLKSIKYYAKAAPNGAYDPWSSTLAKITVSKKNKHFKISKGVLYSKSGKTLVIYPSGKKTAGFTTPKKVTTIDKYAFRGSEVQKVTLTSKVTTIKANAFEESLVKEINFPKNLKSIGDSAFYHTPLTQVQFNEKLISIGDNAFSHCQLQSVYFPYSLETVGDFAFASNRELSTITLNNSCELNYNIFNDCTTYWSEPEPEDYDSKLIQRPITVNLGPKATVPLGDLISNLGEYITFNVDPWNTHYYTKDGSLYKTRGNVKIYTPKAVTQ